MAWFQWISLRPLPPSWDLRRCGWHLAGGEGEGGGPVARLVDGSVPGAAPERLPPALRPRALALGLAESVARARWLAMGYADALPGDTRLDELSQRASRAIAAPPDPARRRMGRLSLDLLTRDARVDGRRLHLHPREFVLLWRLAEGHGAPVARAVLLRDVFDLGFDPGTNRLAVHVCRLRKKLALAGLPSLLVTGPGDGGYRLIVDDDAAAGSDERGDPPQRIPPDPPFPLGPQFPLDRTARLGEHAHTEQELVR